MVYAHATQFSSSPKPVPQSTWRTRVNTASKPGKDDRAAHRMKESRGMGSVPKKKKEDAETQTKMDICVDSTPASGEPQAATAAQ